MSTQVKITNTYSTRWNSIVTIVPSPELDDLDDLEDDLEDWWWEVVFPLTGDGLGFCEGALYEASVIDSDIPELIGEQYNWSG